MEVVKQASLKVAFNLLNLPFPRSPPPLNASLATQTTKPIDPTQILEKEQRTFDPPGKRRSPICGDPRRREMHW